MTMVILMQFYKHKYMIAEGFEFKGRKGEWELHFELREEVVFL